MNIGEIRDYLVVITTSITIFGVFIKTLNNLFLDLIKSKFEPIPAKQKLYDTIIKTVMYIILVIELIFVAFIVITSIFGEYIESESIQGNSALVYFIAWILSFLIISTFGLVIFLSIKLEYILRDNYKKKNKFKKKFIKRIIKVKEKIKFFKVFKYKKKFINIINKTIAIIIAAICMIFMISDILIKDYQNASTMGLFFIIAISMFIISNSVTPVIDVVNYKYTYHLIMKSEGVVISDFFLEFEDNYLIFKNGVQRYISKHEVKEIQKILVNNKLNLFR